MLYQPKKMFVGHIKMFVAGGPDAAKAWCKSLGKISKDIILVSPLITFDVSCIFCSSLPNSTTHLVLGSSYKFYMKFYKIPESVSKVKKKQDNVCGKRWKGKFCVKGLRLISIEICFKLLTITFHLYFQKLLELTYSQIFRKVKQLSIERKRRV